MPPEVLLLYGIAFALLCFLLFHMKLSTVLSSSVKNFAGILLGIALNLFLALLKALHAHVLDKMQGKHQHTN